MDTPPEGKLAPVTLQHLEKADSNDPQHRNLTGEDADDLHGYWASPRLVGSLFGAFLLANSLYIGVIIPTNVVSIINAELGPTANAYLITFISQLFTGVLHLFFARISDVVGRRYFLITGQLFGVVGSIISARAQSVNILIAGSAFVGVGGAAGLLYPVIIHELIPNRHRPWGHAAVTLGVLPSLGFGSAIARSMVAHTAGGWRNIYWLNVAVSGFSAVLFLACYFPPDFHMINSSLTRWQEFKSLDYGGLALYFGGLISLLLGFTWAQGTYPWRSAHVIAPLVVGLITLVAFAIYEVYMPVKQPLLPIRLFKIRNITACIFIGSTMQMVWLASNVFWPLEISALFTTDEVTIGLLSCTTGIALVAGELIFAPLFRYAGFLKWQLVVACSMTAVFTASMAAVTYKTEQMAIAFTVLAGLAVGWIELVTIVIVGLVAPPNDIGVAQGFFGATRQVFGVIAVSIYLAVYSNDLSQGLPRAITTAAETAGLPADSIPDLLIAVGNGTATALEAVPGMNNIVLGALALATKQAYAHALKIVYLATLGFTGIGFIAAFFIVDVDEFFTSYVNKTIHRPTGQRKEATEASVESG